MAGVGAPLATAFVRIKPDTAGFGRDLKSQVSKQGRDAGQEFGKQFSRDAQGRLRDERGRFAAEGSKLGEALDKGFKLKQFSTFAQKLRDIRTVAAATIGPIQQFAAQVAKMAVAAGAAATAVAAGPGLAAGLLSLAGSLAQVAGAAPVAATGLLGIAAIFGTLKAATAGVADGFGQVVKANEALASGAKLSKADTAKLAESLAKLSPTARATVLAFNDLYPSLRRIQQMVQQHFFAGFAADLKALAGRYLPDVAKAGQSLAGVLNQTVRGAVAGLLTSTTEWNFASVLAVARRSLIGFTPILARIPALFVNIAAAAGPAFQGLAGDAARVLAGVVDRLQGALNSGALVAGINRGVAAVKSLGSVAGSVFSVIHSAVLAATHVVGGNLLGSISEVAARFAAFLKSAQGQNSLRTVFAAALPVLRQLGGLLQIVGPALAGLAPVVLTLAGAFTTGLRPVIPVLGRLLATLGTALASVLPAVSDVAVAIGGALTAAISTLQPIIGPLAAAISSLLSPTGVLSAALAALAPVLVILADGLGQVVSILGAGLISALNQVAPILPGIATAFVQLATTVAGVLATGLQLIAPLLGPLASLFAQLVPVVAALAPVLTQVAAVFVNTLAPVLPALIPPIVQIVTVVAQLAAVFAPLVSIAASVIAAFLPFQGLILQLDAAILGGMIPVFKLVAAVVFIAVEGITKAIKFMGDVILGAIIGILQAASHMPFVGKQFGQAADAVRGFRDKFDTNMQAAINQSATARKDIGDAMNGIGQAVRRVPTMKTVTVRAVDQATGVVTTIQRNIDRIRGKDVVVSVTTFNKTGAVTMHAAGGWLTGGTPGQDSIRLANGDLGMPGEFVVNRRAAARNARLLEAINAGQILGGMTGATTPRPAPAPAGGSAAAGVAAAVRDALSGMTIRFDGDGLARLVTGRQAYAAAAGGRR